MRTLFLLPLFFISLFFLFPGCTSTAVESNGPDILPYFGDEQFSQFTGELERYAAPEPDDYGYTNQQYIVKGLSCPSGDPVEITTFYWNNPSAQEVYLAGSPSGPVSQYRATPEAAFNISVRVDYVCGGRPEVANLEAQRKKSVAYFAEEGVLYSQEMRLTCPGDFMPAAVSEKTRIEKGVLAGVDSGEGWIVTSYSLEVAEPYDYSIYGCGEYDEHWMHTYVRSSVNGTSCTVGECRGSWHTFECPDGTFPSVRREIYAGKNCASVSQIKDFRSPSTWYDMLNQPSFPRASTDSWN